MNMQRNGPSARTSAVARGALIALVLVIAFAAPALAQSGTAGRQTSTVEVGPGAVTDDSFKAGEYNGLFQKGANAIGNVDWRGGSAGFNSDSALRWRLKGTDLGLETRDVTAEIGRQGTFRLLFGYDELRRNRSDTYQTPYLGTNTNVLTLPAGWLVPTVAGSSGNNIAVNNVSARGLIPGLGIAPYISSATNSTTMGALLSPTATQIAQVGAAAAADVPLFQAVDLYTRRRTYTAAFAFDFNPQWGVEGSIRPEHKEGVKPMGTVSRNTGGDMSTIIADRIDADHDQVNLTANYKGTRGFAQAAYYGSFFKNQVPFMSWQNWATIAGTVNVMSSAPSNNFSQVSATGGVNITPTTRVVATGSYGRATQNDAFLTDLTTPVVPVGSLNGLVVTTAFTARFTARPAKKLNLTAGYKFDDHDNRTPVNIYQFADAGETPAANSLFPAGAANPLGAVVAQNANANRPYSRKLNQFTSDADLAIVKGQWVKAGYDFEKNDRWCAGSWISCADAATTREHRLRAEWRTNIADSISARVGYSYSTRRTPAYNENAFLALVPYANVSPVGATGGATALSFMLANGWNGWGPALGYAALTGNNALFFPANSAMSKNVYANNNVISELPGMRRFYVADRNRSRMRGSLSWQATTALSFQGGLDLDDDRYPNSTYGVQKARGWATDLDATYVIDATASINVFYTYEHQGSLTAGDGYTANGNGVTPTNGQPGVVGLSGNACDGYTTMQQRNNNAKLDPCLTWSADMLDRATSLGFGFAKAFGRVSVAANYIVSRAHWDNSVTGGNWANNILDGPGAAPTTVAAFFIQATAVPAVNTSSDEFRLTGRYAIDARQALKVGYSYLHMKSNDVAYEGMQFGSLSGVLPTSEQPFNYKVSVFGVSYVLTF